MMIGLDLLAAHLVGDFVLQTDDMAKRKLECWRTRLYHVLLYSMAFVPVIITYAQRVDDWRLALFYWLLILTHFIIDSRRWASGEKWTPKPIMVDQALHVVTLAVLARILL